MRRPPLVTFFWIAVALGGLLAACDKAKTPTGPSPGVTPPATSTPFITRLEISGPGSVPPGETAQFHATGFLSDGSTRDATTEVRWSTSNGSVLSIAVSGVATARQRGEAIVSSQISNAIRSTKEVVVVPAGTYRLVGAVTEAGLPTAVAGARVEVAAGPAAGLSTTTDWDGRYRLYGVPGDGEIRVIKDGYTPHVQSLRLTDHATLNVQLALSGPRPVISGTYTLTIGGGGACNGSAGLSEEMRQRTYSAALTQNGAEVDVKLTGADFAVNSIGKGNQFRGRVEAAGATFQLGGGDFYYYYYYGPTGYPDVVERFPNGTFLVVSGLATTTVSQGGLSGTLGGSLVNYDSRFPRSFSSIGRCGSTTLRFLLSR